MPAPGFQYENVDIDQRLVEAVAEIAKACSATPAQFALAWLLHQGENIAPIPGTRRIERLGENAAATHIEP